MIDMYHRYGEGEKKVAEFLTVYIEEAHAKDDWKVPVGANPGGEDILMHKVIQDRLNAGKKFVEGVKYPIELVCDTMKSQAMIRYEALPERLYIVEQGVVVYKGGGGPFLYKPEEVLHFLQNRFGER